MEERKKRSELKGKEERGRVAVHSQVRKIKQESDSEQIMDWAFGFGQPEVRPVRHQLSRFNGSLADRQWTLPSFLSALYKQFIVEYPVLLRRMKTMEKCSNKRKYLDGQDVITEVGNSSGKKRQYGKGTKIEDPKFSDDDDCDELEC
ncbi:hypothetical protein PVK06_032109 [Gossypium arboreum]|uniref:Uncharacterized protein n=1 Tax=Gossypium arboreum TaxID=29729 RepID=A0ABR0NSX6_GOSAR|nr:hypothetical protein PVK06_032109 [Gossypium arboreum]